MVAEDEEDSVHGTGGQGEMHERGVRWEVALDDVLRAGAAEGVEVPFAVHAAGVAETLIEIARTAAAGRFVRYDLQQDTPESEEPVDVAVAAE